VQLEEKINSIAELCYPIRYTSGPGYEKDCRHKIARQEMLRQLKKKEIWIEVSEIIAENKAADPGAITAKVNEFLQNYPIANGDNH
jgi:hypothetical protein